MKKNDIIQILYECVAACNHCADACLDEKMDMSDCIRLDRVCATTCNALAEVLSTNFKDTSGLINFCFFVCQQCEEECSKHEMNHCRECARICKKCAESCQEYLQEVKVA
ncbi:four-helix bundle copper-binding protein [Galbibacter pacificus]|uniref:Four-helix bundle copper-binding protein n=1 Tax=Galbibacter pacificus TaxID=2996052 RepID=A0ABT6FNU9_9FLAO|nr:four-helix bundle copper-binding protein [Galbibacter pacificus]MDG3581364.1 four-helix bundle copper-binding protein [Galbibacter pacificus]MDG3584842.1 four-helix bundle copper-binding protein [Galbibacter pacificus]